MVRLKASANSAKASAGVLFQFQYGAIKRFPNIDCIVSRSHFNSSMVRLKAVVASVPAVTRPYFNSSMVRLKVTPAVPPTAAV